MQNIIVTVVIVAAAFYVVRMFYMNIKHNKCSCSGCGCKDSCTIEIKESMDDNACDCGCSQNNE